MKINSSHKEKSWHCDKYEIFSLSDFDNDKDERVVKKGEKVLLVPENDLISKTSP